MATIYNLAITKNPNFNTVLGLTNTVFDRNNVRSGYMATENEIQQLWQDIITLEERIDYCCRDIVFWDFQVQIRDNYGNIVSGYLENRRTGIMRRGKNFVIEIPLEPIPKYETAAQGSATNTHYEDNTMNHCVKNGTRITMMNDLCGIVYRGYQGQYYDMSYRKNTNRYGFSRSDVSNSSTSLVANYVRADGSIGTTDYMRGGAGFTANTHFAYVEDGKIYARVLAPIPMDPVTFSTGETGLAYGIQYRLDVRDVTIGGT